MDNEIIEENIITEITQKQENEINAYFGARGAECMDAKTKIIPSKPIDYGPLKDIDGNIIELPVKSGTPKPFQRNSIFH
jgi:hypothetical protein